MVVVTDLTERRVVEESLKQREEQMRRFIEEAPVAIAMFDREMRYLAASQQWYRDCGLGATDLQGRCHYDVFPNLPDAWKAVHVNALAGAVERTMTTSGCTPTVVVTTCVGGAAVHAADGTIGGSRSSPKTSAPGRRPRPRDD